MYFSLLGFLAACGNDGLTRKQELAFGASVTMEEATVY